MATTITQFSYVNAINWALSIAQTPFQPLLQGPDTLTYNGSGIVTTVWDVLYLGYLSLAAGANTTLDLTALTDKFGQAVTPFAHIWLLVLQPTANEWTVEPGAANGLQIFGGSGRVLPFKAGMNQDYKCGSATGAVSGGLVVDGTHKTLKVTNTGAGADVAQILIHGASA